MFSQNTKSLLWTLTMIQLYTSQPPKIISIRPSKRNIFLTETSLTKQSKINNT